MQKARVYLAAVERAGNYYAVAQELDGMQVNWPEVVLV